MPSRVASHLPPSPLTWIILANPEDCLKGRSAAHALNSSACRVTSTISGRVPVKNCKSLVEVNLVDTEITALPSSTFAHCVALNSIWLPPRLTPIGKEVFLNCVALQEVVIPELRDIGNRAFCGCEQLQRFTPLDWGDIEQWAQAEHNALFMCDKFEKPQWVELLLQRNLIRMPLTRNSTTNIANIMPAHGRLWVGALASVCRIEGLGSSPRAEPDTFGSNNHCK